MNIDALVASLSEPEKKTLLKTLQQTSKNNEKEAEQSAIDKNNDIVGKSYKLIKYGKPYAYCHIISPYAANTSDVTVFMFNTDTAYKTVKIEGKHFGRSFDSNSSVFGGKICEMSHATFTKPNSTAVEVISWSQFKDAYTDYCNQVLDKLHNGYFGMENSSQKPEPKDKPAETPSETIPTETASPDPD